MKLHRIFACLLLVVACSEPYDDSAIRSELQDHESRIAQLEDLCFRMNSNLTALQRLVETLEARDYVTGFSAISQGGVETGYEIRFASGSSIRLYHGKDGKAPQLSMRKDSDGKWYWTLDGTWLTDGQGNKMPVSGKDGAAGANGVTPQLKIVDGYWYVSTDNGKTWTPAGKATGDQGEPGPSGTDGVTPRLKIVDGYWYVSMDNGKTWTLTGQATGDQGSAGADGVTPQLKIVDGYWNVSYDEGKTWTVLGKATGDPGANGDSFFQSVTETDDAVVLVLTDGTTISLPKRKKLDIVFDVNGKAATLPGETQSIGYTIMNGTDENVVKAFGQNGWSAKVHPSTPQKGTIEVHAPETIVEEEAEIVVLVYDGAETTIMKTLSFEQGVIQSDVTGLTAAGAGQTFSVTVESNLNVTARYSASWISCTLLPATKAMVNYTLTITAAKNLSGEERAATVTVTDPSGKVVHSIAVVQGTYDLLDDYTDLSGGGETANCYLINGVGSYRFPIIKGNGAKGLIRSGDTAELPDATHAKIVWQSQEILSAVDVYKGFVVFETASSFRTGNAVVAVTNDADEILWSWHIWSTGYRLGSNDISVMNHAKTRTYKMMSQTLGQVGSTALLYQFGRKDPFRQQNATNTASGGTLAKSIQHPDVFYTNSGSDWCSESRTDWWDSGCKSYNSSTTSASTLKGNKTIYDPCPVGYRVPPDDAFTSFTTTGTNTDSESQINSPYPGMVDFIQNSNTYYFYTQVGSNTIAFPAFGGLNASSGKLLKNISYCYSACPSGYSTSRLLQFYAGGVHPQETAYSRALAGSIRPIREEIESDEVYESTDYSKDGTRVTLQTHSVGKGIKILIVGDGFTDRDIDSGLYDECMSLAAEYFFDIEPYATFRNRFDVINMRVVSQTSVFDSEKRTAFKGTFEGGSRISGNLSTAYNKALTVFGTIQDVLIIIVMNTTRYAGTCYMAGDQVSVAFCPRSTQTYYPFNTVIHHEAGGHGFANLGDEYYYSGTISSSEAADLQSCANEYGWYQNLDVTSNASSIKWSSFLTDSNYSSNTSVYEGGYGYTYGVWRPTYESCMNGMYGNFNAPSRYAIYKKIMQRSGESWSWASFKSYDQKNLSMSFNGHYGPVAQPEELPAHCPPVAVPVESLPR